MNFTTFTTFLAIAFASLVAHALPVTHYLRDVFVPPVLTPTTGDVWTIGGTYNVTWDISNAPEQITNKEGQIYLRTGGLTLLDTPLAADFDILLSTYNVTVPETISPGTYQVVLFGDSGNFGKEFEVVDA